MLWFLYAVSYAIIDLFSEVLCVWCSRYHVHKRKLLSFAAGITLAYLFLDFFPTTFQEGMLPFAFALASFSGFYLIHVYLHEQQAHKYVYKEAHLIVRTIYHLVLGVVFYEMAVLPWDEGLLLVLPIFLNGVFSTLASHQVHHAKRVLHLPTVQALEWVSAVSPLVGVFIAFYYSLGPLVTSAALGTVSGVLLYVVVREYIRDDISITYFLIGQVIFIALLLVDHV